MNTRRHTLVAITITALLMATGCSTYKDRSKGMSTAWASSPPSVAAREFGAKAQKSDGSKDSVIWHLEAGAAYRAAGDYTNSNSHFDSAARQIEAQEQKAKVRLAAEAGAIMSNQENLTYQGKSYDKIMLHTYKALNYLALGDGERARPEIIRAYQRQQDAADENARRIEKAKAAEAASKEKEKADKARNDPKFSAALNGITQDLEGFKFYADYVNPFTVYLDGIYFLHAGAGGADLERASKSLKRVIEVAGGNKFVQADLQAATNAFSGRTPDACTYVIFETGQAASLDQVRIDVPIIVSKVSYVGAAFPKLERHTNNDRGLTVAAAGMEETTATLASMDSIIALDFKNEFPAIVSKTIISTIAKAVAAYAVNEAASRQDAMVGLVSQLFTAATQAAMNIADTRSWTTLPKEFQVARLATPPDRKLTLKRAGGPPFEVNLAEGAVNVVYAKAITASSPLIVSQFRLR